jgi:hypothetical protein
MLRVALLIMLFACAACSATREHAPPPPTAVSQPQDGAIDVAFDAAKDASIDVLVDAADAGDAALAGCSAFCDCMIANCASEASYPFPDENTCKSWCSKRSPIEQSCFAEFCKQASLVSTPSIKTHFCEHAAGLYGTTECM